jgi:undecaprenyl diphosphate synthase
MKNIDFNNLPRHIAIIMDGNGRWAQKHCFGRIYGHKKGAQTVKLIVRACREIGIKYLTMYTFSMENWNRPVSEVQAVMMLVEKYLRSGEQEMLENNIRLTSIGNLESLKDPLKKTLYESIEKTSQNTGMTLILALSYGGRDEIVEATKKLLHDVMTGNVSSQEVTKEVFASYLYTTAIPDPDLIIRTSGEYRLSNFLLWQSAYTELYFTDVLWPEFTRKDLLKAIADYQQRQRRFGLTAEQIKKDFD